MSVVRYTNEELEMRRRAQAVLDDAATGDWHRKRAMGDLRRTEKAARARAAKPATVLPEKFCERCQVPFEICHCNAPKPTRDELAAVAAKDAAENAESSDDLTPCSLCLIPRGQCHHSGRRIPTDQINFLLAQMMGRS